MKSEFPTLLRFGWRDGVRHWKQGLFFALTLFIGLGTLATIRFYAETARDSLNRKTQTLLGADLMLSSNHGFEAPFLNKLFTFPGQRSREARLLTMAQETRNGQSRLIQVRGVEAGFPYYGTPDVAPVSAWRDLTQPQPTNSIEFTHQTVSKNTPSAASAPELTTAPIIVDESLALQWELNSGDTLQIGQQRFQVIGILRTLPGEPLVTGVFVPRVWVPLQSLEHTGLLEQGSIVRHFIHLASDDKQAIAAWQQTLENEIRNQDIHLESPETRKADTGTLLSQIESFLSLSGLAALLLGAIGLASATHIYLRAKEPQIALLRCIGVAPLKALLPFVLQMVALGGLASCAGIVVGMLGQSVLLNLMAPLLPVDVEPHFSWLRILEVFLTGSLVFILCATPALLPLRHLSPLAALRRNFQGQHHASWKDPLTLTILILAVMGFVGLTIMLTPNLGWAFWFLTGTAALLGFLLLAGKALLAISHSSLFRNLPFVWKHGIANLHRPNNRTLLQILILGTGSVLLLSVLTASHLLLQQASLVRQTDDPDMIFFDIQPDQTEGFSQLVQELGHPINELAPVITARLETLNAKTLSQLQQSDQPPVEEWAFHREYRLSWRDYLVSNESVVAGEWISHWGKADQPVPVSVAERVVQALNLKLGDRMLFDIQGVSVETYVASIRRVEWRQVQTNFFIIFPTGFLEQAPRFYIASLLAGSPEQSTRLQQEIIRKYPNISSVSLGQIMDTVEEILDQAAWILNWVGSVSILTGVIVLIGTLLGGRQERIREIALWRLLGLEVSGIRKLLAVEYGAIGAIVAIASTLAALIVGWILCEWVFRLPLSYPLYSLIAYVLIMPLITLALGWLFGGKIHKESPLTTIMR